MKEFDPTSGRFKRSESSGDLGVLSVELYVMGRRGGEGGGTRGRYLSLNLRIFGCRAEPDKGSGEPLLLFRVPSFPGTLQGSSFCKSILERGEGGKEMETRAVLITQAKMPLSAQRISHIHFLYIMAVWDQHNHNISHTLYELRRLTPDKSPSF